MGIDRVGKGAGLPPPVEGARVPGAAPAERTGKAFAVDPAAHADRAASAAAVAGPQASPLDRLRAGEIDVHAYVDLKVGEATVHLHGLPAHQMESIKAALRSQIADDPMVRELFMQATGREPPQIPDE